MQKIVQKVLQRYLENTVITAGGSKTLYHIGNRPGQPKPKKRKKQWNSRAREGEAWTRPWLDKPVESGVFLTDNPVQVALNHRVKGNVYAYSVPNWVIKESGGIHKFDSAREVLVPKDLWKHVKFEGKSMNAEELEQRVYLKSKGVDTRSFNEGPLSQPTNKPKKDPVKYTKQEQQQFEQWASKMRYPNPHPRGEIFQNRITFRTLKQHAQSKDPRVKLKAMSQIEKLKKEWERQRK